MPGLWDLSIQIRAQADRFLAKHEPPSADFSRVATEILQSFPAQEFSFEDLCDKRLWLERDQNHKSSTFSDISLTLWRTPTYFLDFYFWVDRSTSIHDHNFSGGFRVMRGHYLQTSYRFKPGEEVFTGINRGQLKPIKTTSLRFGDALAIHDEDGLIHQTFHGEVPCVTLCLRSPNTAPFLHSYLTTGWRICMQRPTGTTRQRINFIKALARKNEWAALEDEVKLIPLDVALAATIQDPSVLYADERWWNTLSRAHPQHSDLIRSIYLDVIRENSRCERIKALIR